MSGRRWFLALVAVAASSYFLLTPKPASVGDKLPAVTLCTLDGEEVSTADLLGNTLFIEFFTTWCPACQQAYPQTQHLSRTFADRPGVLFLSVSRGEDPATVHGYVRRFKKDWPVLVDRERELYDQIFKKGVPAYAIIDPAGRLAYTRIGWWASGNEGLATLTAELRKAAGI